MITLDVHSDRSDEDWIIIVDNYKELSKRECIHIETDIKFLVNEVHSINNYYLYVFLMAKEIYK